MEVLKSFTIIKKPCNFNYKELATDIKIIRYDLSDMNVYFRYVTDGRIYYGNGTINVGMGLIYFMEFINGSSLWTINITPSHHNNLCYSGTHYCYKFSYTIILNVNEIKKYINSSAILNETLYNHYYNKLSDNVDIKNKSFIPTNKMIGKPKNFIKVDLYDYQRKTIAKMLEIELSNKVYEIDYINDIKIGDDTYKIDPFDKKFILDNKERKLQLKSKGGILADEMGLGKTISCIGLIHLNPSNITDKYTKCCSTSKLNTRATLIICPSHLVKQWEMEVRKCNDKLKILTIVTQKDHNKITYNEFIDNDIIITSQQFIMNFSGYQMINYRKCSSSTVNFQERLNTIYSYYNTTFSDETKLATETNPLFEYFNFHRLILDEAHEIFGNLLNKPTLSNYISEWLNNIDTNYNWYVSGTPFVNKDALYNTFSFIKLHVHNNIYKCNFDCKNYKDISRLINKENLWDNILEHICIRHLKKDVDKQVNIVGYEEEIIWIKLTEMEQKLYDNKKSNSSREYLQQLCCHPLIVDNKNIYNDKEIDLDVMQDRLVEYHKERFNTYTLKLDKLDNTSKAYAMTKKSFENIITESKYMISLLERIKKPNILDDENCSICLCDYDNPVMTLCGHIYCSHCIKEALKVKQLCPNCKSDLTNQELLVINGVSKNIINEDNIHMLMKKYGSKLGKLILMVQSLIENKNNRIIIFSQWDYMLLLIGKTLGDNNINNCFIKGNVHVRTSSINKFKKDDNDMRVIMLSLKNSASGTNLTEASHIFFVEPIDAEKEEINTIESQAIARACRIGQKQKVKLIRILLQNTIEEEIYKDIHT